MMKIFRHICKIGFYIVLCSALAISSLSKGAAALSLSDYYTENDINSYDPRASVCGPSNVSGPGAESIANVPDPWRSLIAGQISKFPDVDPRLVAATLWVENRGWPPYDKKWGVSGAGAAGPWQFIVPTWQSMMPGVPLEDRNKPEVAVEAAFKHQLKSAGLPILPGYTGDAQAAYNTLPFYRSFDDGKNSLMYYMAKYNGSGAPSGVTLSQFPRNENSDYVRMAFWLISSGFTRAYLAEGDKFVDPKDTSAASGGGEATNANLQNCGDGGNVNSEGYAFPVGGMAKNVISNGYGWPCTGICHHDKTPAFDLTHKDAQTGKDGAAVGKPVYALYKGKIENLATYHGERGCHILQLVGEDKAQYWYIHIQNVTVKEGETVSAGQQIAEIGERRCTGKGTYPHLHIDQSPDGSLATRNKRLVPLINKLYEELPDERQ